MKAGVGVDALKQSVEEYVQEAVERARGWLGETGARVLGCRSTEELVGLLTQWFSVRYASERLHGLEQLYVDERERSFRLARLLRSEVGKERALFVLGDSDDGHLIRAVWEEKVENAVDGRVQDGGEGRSDQ